MKTSELKELVDATGSHFFDRKTMKFFGDTMANYGIVETTVNTWTQEDVPVYELYRKRPVKHGLTESAYFHRDTFERIFAKIEGGE